MDAAPHGKRLGRLFHQHAQAIAHVCAMAGCKLQEHGRFLTVHHVQRQRAGGENRARHRRQLGAEAGRRGVDDEVEHRPAQLVIANRTVATAQALAAQFAALGGDGVVSACGYDAIDGGFDLVINATAASLSAELAAFGFLNPVLAGAAMAFSSVSVVSNALLLKFWKPDDLE